MSECKELHSIIFEKTLHNETVQDDINIIAAEFDENKLSDLLYTLCIKRSALENNLGYIKDKLSAPDKIHDLQSETIEQIKRLAKILSEGSKEIRVTVRYFMIGVIAENRPYQMLSSSS